MYSMFKKNAFDQRKFELFVKAYGVFIDNEIMFDMCFVIGMGSLLVHLKNQIKNENTKWYWSQVKKYYTLINEYRAI